MGSNITGASVPENAAIPRQPLDNSSAWCFEEITLDEDFHE